MSFLHFLFFTCSSLQGALQAEINRLRVTLFPETKTAEYPYPSDVVRTPDHANSDEEDTTAAAVDGEAGWMSAGGTRALMRAARDTPAAATCGIVVLPCCRDAALLTLLALFQPCYGGAQAAGLSLPHRFRI